MTQSTQVLLPLLVFLLIGWVQQVAAQNPPPKNVIAGRQTVDAPHSVYAADLDDDGDQDVLSASFGDDRIAWYKNTSGSFSGPKIIIDTANIEAPVSVHAADLNGDGNQDVLSASTGDNKVAWYKNTGGDFSEQRIISTNADGPRSVDAADLDGDGDQDVLSASHGDGKIAWYENTDGRGSFSTQNVITTGLEQAQSVHAADLDGDGDQDVLSASAADNKVAWYENTGGTFSEPKVITVNAGDAKSVHAADLDDDGDQDVLSASRADNKIAWYENADGQGSFSNQKIITSNAEGAFSVYSADLDGDGDQDVLSASRFDNKIAAYDNQGGSFGSPLVITTSAEDARSVYATDLDGDGNPDVLSASKDDDKVAWYRNRLDDGQGFGSQHVIVPIPSPVDRPESIFTADVDSDDDQDVLSASREDDKIAWYENTDGNGTFSGQNVITTKANRARSVYASDLDGDGDVDVLSASQGDADGDEKVAWYENTDGEGSFSDQKVISTRAQHTQSVYAADLDGDGDPDVLSASSLDNKIAWYENTGGSFSDQKVITTDADGAHSVFAGDLDKDGDQDVLSASQGDDKIAWYENTGNGEFSEEKVISTSANGAESVYATDLEKDGDLDVISASFNDDKIAWYENLDGEGTFSEENVITTRANGAASVHAGDLNGDGDKDILSASGNGIYWYEQSTAFESISFSDQKSIDETQATVVYVSDLTGNGSPDVLAALIDSEVEELVWYENTSDVLPVNLTGFTARLDGDTTVLTWQTASEQNNAGFDVQHRSASRKTWETLGFVDSKASRGTSTEAKTYRFTTSGLKAGTHRFRLRQVDLDGTPTLTDPVTVEIQMEEALALTAPSPNPASADASLSFAVKNNTKATVTIYNVLGKKVETVYNGTPTAGESHRLRLDTSGLSSGTYFIRLSAGKDVCTQRLTVVR